MAEHEGIYNTAQLYPKSFEHHLCLHNFAPFSGDEQVSTIWTNMLDEVGQIVQEEGKAVQKVRNEYRNKIDAVRRNFILAISQRISHLEAVEAQKPKGE